MRKMLVMLASVALLAEPGPSLAQATDPEVVKGVRQAEDADYEGAILTLDAAVRRLAAQSASSADLAQAYLYLGIAYLGKGHETSARARFREAIAQAQDLRLSPEKFAPRVIELFEQAREEAARTAAPPPRKTGSKKGLVLLGIGGAAAAGIALAAGGGGGGSGGAGGGAAAASPGSASNPPAGTETFGGLLGARGGESASVPLGPFRAGPCRAELSWSEARTEVRMFVNDASTQVAVGETRLLTAVSSVVDWTCSESQRYRADLFLQDPKLDLTYELKVTHP